MGVSDEVGKVATSVSSTLGHTPVLLGFLVLVAGFLGFNAWRDKAQFELIAKLVTDIRDCRGGEHPKGN
jgi:hypothetical protein